MPGGPGTPDRRPLARRQRQHPLEVERQVRGDDGDVHEVDHVLVLPPVQVLVDVQRLHAGLWSRVRPGPLPPDPGHLPVPPGVAGGLLPRLMRTTLGRPHTEAGRAHNPQLPLTRLRPEPSPPLGAFPNWNHQGNPIAPIACVPSPASAGPGTWVRELWCGVRAGRWRSRGAGGGGLLAGKGHGGARGGHKPPRRAGTSRTPGGVAPKSRSRGAWLKDSEICYRGFVKNKQWSEAPEQTMGPRAPLGKGHPCGCCSPSEVTASPHPGDVVVDSRAQGHGRPRSKCLLHLVQVVGAPVVDVMAQAGSHHGEGLQVRVVALQFACLQRQVPGILPPGQRPRPPPSPLQPDPSAPPQLSCSPPISRAGGVRQSEVASASSAPLTWMPPPPGAWGTTVISQEV